MLLVFQGIFTNVYQPLIFFRAKVKYGVRLTYVVNFETATIKSFTQKTDGGLWSEAPLRAKDKTLAYHPGALS